MIELSESFLEYRLCTGTYESHPLVLTGCTALSGFSRKPAHRFTHLINTVVSSFQNVPVRILLKLVRNRILNVSLSNPVRCATGRFAGHGTFLYSVDTKRRLSRGASPPWIQEILLEKGRRYYASSYAAVKLPGTQSLYTLCEVFVPKALTTQAHRFNHLIDNSDLRAGDLN